MSEDGDPDISTSLKTSEQLAAHDTPRVTNVSKATSRRLLSSGSDERPSGQLSMLFGSSASSSGSASCPTPTNRQLVFREPEQSAHTGMGNS